MSSIEILKKIRGETGSAQTIGLGDETILHFLAKDKNLEQAIKNAKDKFEVYKKEFGDILLMSEEQAIDHVQEDIVNFYPELQVNPYISLAAKGPWIVTLHGAVLHDSGGYGMLGLGHAPSVIEEALDQNQVIANVMTANLSQKKLCELLKKEIGHSTGKGSPFSKFLFMNSGSESVTVAARIADLNAKKMTDDGGRHAGKAIKIMAHEGGFHGRTDRPAQASDSTMKANKQLASFRDRQNLITIEPNNIDSLKAAFKQADADGVFIEMLLMEPVMGEGNPGLGITPEYYAEARRLTKEKGTLFLIDSIQAGLRAHGCLSIMDYPGFENLDPPDFETYSKALNAGQFPLSVLALTEETAALYQTGVYGNTMTTNPRAMDVACAVLGGLTPELRKNIQASGAEFMQKFQGLAKEFPEAVTGCSGTGLLCALHLNPEGYQVVGEKGIELYMRHQGIGVIHGGTNALRFTPHFAITTEEVDLVIDQIRSALARGPVYS